MASLLKVANSIRLFCFRHVLKSESGIVLLLFSIRFNLYIKFDESKVKMKAMISSEVEHQYQYGCIPVMDLCVTVIVPVKNVIMRTNIQSTSTLSAALNLWVTYCVFQSIKEK